MATERADMLLDRLQAKDALVFNVGDTLDTKLNIALVVITFLATQTAWLITEKRVEGGWLIAQSVSALALIAAGALTIWALWPTNYATENAEDWDLWLERLDAYFASDPNRDDKVRQVATDGAIKRARERIASNSRVNNFKTQLLTVSFWCSSLSLALNLATVASFAAKRLF